MQHHRSSVAPPARLSTAGGGGGGGVLSRLSIGLSDALHWLGVRGSIPTAADAGATAQAASATAQQQQQQGGGLSPILASPDATLSAAGAEEEEAGSTARQAGAAAAAPAGRALPAISPIQESPAAAETPASAVAATMASPAAAVEVQGVEPVAAGAAERAALAAGQEEEEEAAAAERSPEQQQRKEEGGGVEALGRHLAEGLRLDEGVQAAAPAAAEEALTPLEQLVALCGQPVREAGPAPHNADVEACASWPTLTPHPCNPAPPPMQTTLKDLPSMEGLLGQHVDLRCERHARRVGGGSRPLCAP